MCASLPLVHVHACSLDTHVGVIVARLLCFGSRPTVALSGCDAGLESYVALGIECKSSGLRASAAWPEIQESDLWTLETYRSLPSAL